MNKIKIKSINKKLLSGALALTLLMVPLTGCSQDVNSIDTGFVYDISEQGEYEAKGAIGFYELKNYYYIEIYNQELNSIEFYIAVFTSSSGKGIYCEKYYNLLTGNFIIKTDVNGISMNKESNREITVKEKLEDYLYALDEIHAEYTEDDVIRILDRMKEIDFDNRIELIKK